MHDRPDINDFRFTVGNDHVQGVKKLFESHSSELAELNMSVMSFPQWDIEQSFGYKSAFGFFGSLSKEEQLDWESAMAKSMNF